MRLAFAFLATTALVAGCTAGTGPTSHPGNTSVSTTGGFTGVRKVDASQGAALSKSGTAMIVDARSPGDYVAGHLRYANNIDIASAGFDASVGRLPKTRSYLVYCGSAECSGKAVERMKGLGFTQIADAGAFAALAKAGAPVETAGVHAAPQTNPTGAATPGTATTG